MWRVFKKGGLVRNGVCLSLFVEEVNEMAEKEKLTIVVFSGELDKALAEIEEEIERVKQTRIERRKQGSRERLRREAVLKVKKDKT